MIRIEQIKKSYGSFPALDGVSFEIHKNEIFGLVGPNGAGKTTLLKILLGVVIPTSGRCYISDICVQTDGLRARRITTYLPSDGQFYEWMTPRSFLTFAVAGYPALDAALQGELLDIFNIPIDKKIRAFSHGMKRKLGIIQALVPRTPVAILDEPEEGLDPTARHRFLQILERERKNGRTILLSSHQLDSVARICDRVAFIAAGKLLDCDTLANIRNRAGKNIRVRLPQGADPRCLQLDEAEKVIAGDGFYTVVAKNNERDLLIKLSQLPIDSLEFRQLRLEDVYADLYQVERES